VWHDIQVNKKSEYIIGIDEAGRGPLAGSVYVGVVALPKNYKSVFKKTNTPKKLADSKKLSEKQREEWFSWIQKNKILYAYATATPKQIDTINIARACDCAAQKAYNKLTTKNQKLKTNNRKQIKQGGARVIADGGITISVQKNIVFQHYPKADELIPAVSLASIVAKVKRDAYMKRMHVEYPHYAFDVHKGYGTKKHYHALYQHGLSPIHRLTFLRSLHRIQKRK